MATPLLLPPSRRWLAPLLLTLALLPAVAEADDLDIYIAPVTLPQQAPLTALALDLNLTGSPTVACNNVLTSSEQNCTDIRGRVTVGDLLTYLGAPSTILAGLDPNALLSDLSSGVRTLLAGALGNPVTLTMGGPEVYVLALQQILTSLLDSRVGILLNHANHASGSGNSIALCAFADKSSLPAARQATVGCSNGAYLFSGLVNLADPLQLAALLNRIRTALLGDLVNTAGNSSAPVPRAFSANHKYQTKEIYAELAKYLRGDAIFNGHLGVFDYGDNNPNDNLNASFPLLSWDTTAEKSDNKSYQSALSAYPQACSISLVHLQLTQAGGQDDSDADLKVLFPEGDSDRNGTLTLPELVSAADNSGFLFNTDDRRRIQSRFVVQENLFTNGDLSDLDRINSTGSNVSTYSNALGLLGRGKSIAGSLVKPLSVDTSLISLTIAASRSTATGILQAAYLPVFRADPEQRPAWPGNLKRLKLRSRAAPNQNLFDVVDARDNPGSAANPAIGSDGRIRSTALTIWTDASQLGSGVTSDGGKADLGGSGQKIPGYQFGGGGNPGRGATGSVRSIYYDSNPASTGAALALLNADDSAVRAELLAATGATPYTSPNSACSSACNATFSSCGLLCTSNQTACSGSCSTTNTSCNTLCLPGSLGDSCRNSCSSNLTSCNTGCNNTASSCNSSCSTNLNSCLSSCGAGGSDRTADTLVRELLLYARGFDVGTRTSPKGTGPTSSPTNTGVTARSWMLGAVLHSRPLAINYGKRNGINSAEVVRVVYGSADGMLHMLDDATGIENWGFMPQTVMGALATLRDNQSGAALPYGVDGSPMVLIRDRSGNNLNSAGDGVISSASSVHDRVLLIFGLRRGGAAYYALDVTEPDNPRLAWRITTAGLQRAGQTTVDAGSAAQFAALGLAFSTPQVARIRLDLDGDSSTTADIQNRTALLFGGGYNGGRNGSGAKVGKDLNNSRAAAPLSTVGVDDGSGSTDRGNAVFMIDAATGQLLWRAVRSTTTGASYSASSKSYLHPLLVDSIASELTALDTDNDGYTDRLYVGDTGGRLWRADFPGAFASAWTFTPLASVGRHNNGNNDLANDRRIFFAPDYVPLRNTANPQGSDLVLFGTGDREDSLNLITQNWFYGFRDTDTVSGKAASEIILTEAAIPQHSAFTDLSTNALRDVTTLATGYRFRYTRSGEKHFSAPVTVGGTATFTSYVPPDPSAANARVCTPSEGVSRLYSIGVRKSEFRSINNVSSAGRDVPLSTGLPGEINVLNGTNQAAGGQIFNVPAKDTYRASWRERLGETQK